MQRPIDDRAQHDEPNLPRIFSQLAEARAAAQILYELFPNPAAIRPLSKYLDDALSEIWDELVKMEGWMRR